VPTVTVVTEPFLVLAKTTMTAENFSDSCFATVPHPLGMLKPDEVRKRAEEAFNNIVALATSWRPASQETTEVTQFPAQRFEFSGTTEDLNGLFLLKEWSMGLPIIPPTDNLVAEMLKGTSRRPEEILGQVPPKNARLTVELVAVHAAMAGCRPSYMPALIAALEAFLDPDLNWRGALATTGTTQFVVVFNGPVVKRIGIGYGQGSAGKGYHANGSIGYAINLIAYVVGASRPPSIDRSTLGSPSDYVCWVFGENEDALPKGWQPLHVQRGFNRSDSAVTVMCSYPVVANADHWSVVFDDHLKWWSHIASPMLSIGGPCRPGSMDLPHMVVLGPEHACLVASEGRSHADFRKAFWERTRIPLSAWPPGGTEFNRLEKALGPLGPDSLIPVSSKPEQIMLVVGGGDGKHSHYFPPFVGSFAASRVLSQ